MKDPRGWGAPPSARALRPGSEPTEEPAEAGSKEA